MPSQGPPLSALAWDSDTAQPTADACSWSACGPVPCTVSPQWPAERPSMGAWGSGQARERPLRRRGHLGQSINSTFPRGALRKPAAWGHALKGHPGLCLGTRDTEPVTGQAARRLRGSRIYFLVTRAQRPSPPLRRRPQGAGLGGALQGRDTPLLGKGPDGAHQGTPGGSSRESRRQGGPRVPARPPPLRPDAHSGGSGDGTTVTAPPHSSTPALDPPAGREHSPQVGRPP